MSDSSFDIVSRVDKQEADNALNQASKEIAQRYDFKGTGAEIPDEHDADDAAADLKAKSKESSEDSSK